LAGKAFFVRAGIFKDVDAVLFTMSATISRPRGVRLGAAA